MPVAEGEVLRQAIIERQLVLVVERHRLVFDRRLRADVGLVGREHEPVAPEMLQRVVGIGEVGRFMDGDPTVVDIGNGAAPRVVEGEDGAAVAVEVRIAAQEGAAGGDLACQAVDAAVIVGQAAFGAIAVAVLVVIAVDHARPVVGPARHIGQGPELIVEGMVLLHHDDDVLQVPQVAIGQGRPGSQQAPQPAKSAERAPRNSPRHWISPGRRGRPAMRRQACSGDGGAVP
jgi:hypothetical protein